MSHAIPRRRALVAAAVPLLLGWAAGPLRATYPSADPVWELQQALQVRQDIDIGLKHYPSDANDPEALKQREAKLQKAIGRLNTAGELRRALTLSGWRDQISELAPSLLPGRPGEK